MFQLVRPALEHLSSYKDALQRGWGPDNMRPAESGKQELQKIAENPGMFIENMHDPEAKAGPVTLPDGSVVPRIPGFHRWMWDGEFCGSIGFRWQKGTPELPPTCFGHVGYSVVPWKQRRGYATRALFLLLPLAKKQGLPYISITADPDNIPSQKVIIANGGVLVGSFQEPAAYGGGKGLLFRINL